MNYPGAEPTRYQMEIFVSDPEGRGIKPHSIKFTVMLLISATHNIFLTHNLIQETASRIKYQLAVSLFYQ